MSDPEPVEKPVDHYFTAAPASKAERKQITMKLLNGERVKIASAEGVFSADEVDEGTAVLLKKAPAPTEGATVLDLGCGYGVISLAYGLEVPGLHITAIDTNERALELTKENASAFGLTNVTTALPNDVDPAVSFDYIYSNPPIRIGKKEMQGILKGWLMRLASEGVAYFVIHKHLGSDSVQKWLNEQGWDCERISSSHGFRVLQVKRAGE